MSVLSAKLAPAEGSATEPIQKFNLETRPNHIMLTFPGGNDLGFLKEHLTKALEGLLRQSDLELEGVAMAWRLRERIGKADKGRDAIVNVNINVYGPRPKAAEVGDDLSRHKVWLQRPDDIRPQIPYHNPHFLHFADLEETPFIEQVRNEVAVTQPRATEERLEQLVSEVHDNLQRAHGLGRVRGDRRLKTDLLE